MQGGSLISKELEVILRLYNNEHKQLYYSIFNHHRPTPTYIHM